MKAFFICKDIILYAWISIRTILDFIDLYNNSLVFNIYGKLRKLFKKYFSNIEHVKLHIVHNKVKILFFIEYYFIIFLILIIFYRILLYNTFYRIITFTRFIMKKRNRTLEATDTYTYYPFTFKAVSLE